MKALIKILVVATLFGSSTVFASSMSAGKASCPLANSMFAKDTAFKPANSNLPGRTATGSNGQQAGWTQ